VMPFDVIQLNILYRLFYSFYISIVLIAYIASACSLNAGDIIGPW